MYYIMYTCPAVHSQPGLQAASHITVLCNIRSVHVRRQDNAQVLISVHEQDTHLSICQ